MVSPAAKWTAKNVNNSNGVTTQMAMRKCIAIFHFIGNRNSVDHFGECDTREMIRESSPAINLVFSRVSGDFNNKI